MNIVICIVISITGLISAAYLGSTREKKYIGNDDNGKPLYAPEDKYRYSFFVFLSLFLSLSILSIIGLCVPFNLFHSSKNLLNTLLSVCYPVLIIPLFKENISKDHKIIISIVIGVVISILIYLNS